MISALKKGYDEKITKLLVNKKYDLNKKNNNGDSAFVFLLKNYSLEFIKEISCFFKLRNFNPIEFINNDLDILKVEFIFEFADGNLFCWKFDSYLLWKKRKSKMKYWEIFNNWL